MNPAEIRRLIRQRQREITYLERMLNEKPVPARLRKQLTLQLHGCRMNRQSWVDWMERKAA